MNGTLRVFRDVHSLSHPLPPRQKCTSGVTIARLPVNRVFQPTARS